MKMRIASSDWQYSTNRRAAFACFAPFTTAIGYVTGSGSVSAIRVRFARRASVA